MPEPNAYLPFRKARLKARKLGLSGSIEYMALLKKDRKNHQDLPSNPHYVYRDDGWVNWGDYLGTGKVSTAKVRFLPFREARERARRSGVEHASKWREFVLKRKKRDLPLAPFKYYKNKGWISWEDWLAGKKKKSVNS